MWRLKAVPVALRASDLALLLIESGRQRVAREAVLRT
jgi:hypothetical protein